MQTNLKLLVFVLFLPLCGFAQTMGGGGRGGGGGTITGSYYFNNLQFNMVGTNVYIKNGAYITNLNIPDSTEYGAGITATSALAATVNLTNWAKLLQNGSVKLSNYTALADGAGMLSNDGSGGLVWIAPPVGGGGSTNGIQMDSGYGTNTTLLGAPSLGGLPYITNASIFNPIIDGARINDGINTNIGLLTVTPHTTNNWIKTHGVANTNALNRAVFAGHSWMAGNTPSGYVLPMPYWWTNNFVTNYVEAVNVASNALRADFYVSNFVSMVKPYSTVPGTNGWLFLNTGLIELWAGTNAAGLFAVVSNICYAAHSNGMYVVLYTQPATDSEVNYRFSGLGDCSTNRLAYNELLRNATTLWDYLVDLGSLWDFQLTWGDPNGEHPSNDGGRLLAEMTYDALRPRDTRSGTGTTTKNWTPLLQVNYSNSPTDLRLYTNRMDTPILGDPFGSLRKRPFKGWSSWNNWGHGWEWYAPYGAALASPTTASNVLRTWATNGMLASGFDTICLEECIFDWTRSGGHLVGNTNWPGASITNICSYAHSLGMKVNTYTAYGSLTCENVPGTTDEFIATDILDWNTWGFDGLFLDSCDGTHSTNWMISLYRTWPNAILRGSRPMELTIVNTVGTDWTYLESANLCNAQYVFTANFNGGYDLPYHPDQFVLGAGAGNQACFLLDRMRTNTFNVIMDARNELPIKYFNRPGHSIMLYQCMNLYQGGGGDSDYDQCNQALYTGLTMFNAPMRVGFWTPAEARGFYTFTNRWAADISGDSGWAWPIRVQSNALSDVYYKDLYDTPGAKAVFLWNYDQTNSAAMSVALSTCGFDTVKQTNFLIRDVWQLTNIVLNSTTFTYTVGSNSCAMFKVTPVTYEYGTFKGDGSGLTNLSVSASSTNSVSTIWSNGVSFATGVTNLDVRGVTLMTNAPAGNVVLDLSNLGGGGTGIATNSGSGTNNYFQKPTLNAPTNTGTAVFSSIESRAAVTITNITPAMFFTIWKSTLPVVMVTNAWVGIGKAPTTTLDVQGDMQSSNATFTGNVTVNSNVSAAKLVLSNAVPGVAIFTNTATETNMTVVPWGTNGQILTMQGSTNAVFANAGATDLSGYQHSGGSTNLTNWSQFTSSGYSNAIYLQAGTMATNADTVAISNAVHRLVTYNMGTNDAVVTNLTVDFDVPSTEVYFTNNLGITNFAGLTAGTSKPKVIFLFPQETTRTLYFPAYGTNLGVVWSTNKFPLGIAPFTSLTNGNTYVLSIQSRGTNLYPSLTEWR